MDKCTRTLSEHIQTQPLNRLIDDIYICKFLYNGRYLVILQFISTSLIFAGLTIATYKDYRGLLPS